VTRSADIQDYFLHLKAQTNQQMVLYLDDMLDIGIDDFLKILADADNLLGQLYRGWERRGAHVEDDTAYQSLPNHKPVVVAKIHGLHMPCTVGIRIQL